LNKGDFTKTTLPMGWFLSTLLAVQTDNLSSKLPRKYTNCTTPLQGSHFPAPLRHAEKQPLYWNWEKLSLQSSSLQSPKLNVN